MPVLARHGLDGVVFTRIWLTLVLPIPRQGNGVTTVLQIQALYFFSMISALLFSSLLILRKILERRFPVILGRFGLRQGSGGAGIHRGGDGIVRELMCVLLFGP